MLTQQQIDFIVNILSERAIELRGKVGTEFTQAQLVEIIRILRSPPLSQRIVDNKQSIEC